MAINDRSQARTVISIDVRTPMGWETHYVSPSEASTWDDNPDACAARMFDMTEAEYTEWIELHGMPLCGSVTKKGKLCRASIGRVHMSASEWLATHRSAYCHALGGEKE
jgi:hypothetical protein